MSTADERIDQAQAECLVLAGLLSEDLWHIRAASDVNFFIESCMSDESGRDIRQAPFHYRIQRAFTDHDTCVIFAPPEHGKTIQTALRIIWEIGRDPTRRVLYVSSSATQASKVLGVVANNIKFNEAVWRVFPRLRPTNFDKWTTTSIQLAGFRGTKKDYTMQAVGVGGSILGSRVDVAVLDDVIDLANSSTASQRRKMVEWFESTLLTRITDGGRIWLIGTPWHKSDLPHVMEERGAATLRFPVEDNPGRDGSGAFLWPARWNRRRLEARRRQMSGWRFQQQYYIQDSSPEGSPFSLKIIEDCYGPARTFGQAGAVPDGYQFITGVDLAIGKNLENDLTAFVTLASDGTHKSLVDVRAGRYGLFEIKAVAEQVFSQYGGVFVVENNAAQDYMVQLLKGATRIPVMPSTTSRGTKISEDFGIPAMAVDLENGRWTFPARPRVPAEVKELVDEMVAYNPGHHTGDRLMALYLAWSGVDKMFRRSETSFREISLTDREPGEEKEDGGDDDGDEEDGA